jgi:hypothetical protein
MFPNKINSMGPVVANVARIDPRTFAEIHGAIQCVERCRKCGAIGVAHYEQGGWGFEPRGSCGRPSKCGEKPNDMSGPFLHIVGGRS